MTPTEQRVALVTGGGTGIGAAISARLSDGGVRVLFGQRTEEEVGLATRLLARHGRHLKGLAADLSTAEGCRQLVRAAFEEWERIDILVNNAGITGPPAIANFLEADDAHLDQVIDVNLKAAFRCAREAARLMVSSGGGVIVNIASVAAHAAQPGAAAYVASKAGLVGLTRALALELAEHSIRVVCISPGDINTSAGSPSPSEPTGGGPWSRRTPMRRRGTPDDIAAMVEFVCSDNAGYVTGSEIVVDGGWLTY